MSPIISVSHVGKTYASGHEALRDISLDIRRGEILALLGPNGAGKTTLIGIICGLVKASRGSVVVDGSVPIRELNRAMSWHLPDEEATTVAGLVIHEARSIPERGQSFTFHGFRFRVLRRERNRITALRIIPVQREPELLEPRPKRAGTSF